METFLTLRDITRGNDSFLFFNSYNIYFIKKQKHSNSKNHTNYMLTQQINKFWGKNPLPVILVTACIVRLLAVFFAKGYGMHDDHFLVLEWAKDMLDKNFWFGPDRISGHSLVYPGLHYFILLFFKKCGLYNPDFIMYFVRFFHAALSLLTVYFGYKTALLCTDKKTAAECGLLLAVLWIFPFMCVRNLIEMVCIPFIMIASYLFVKYDRDRKLILPFLGGLFLGLAFTFRYQSNLLIAGFFLIYLFRREFSASLLLALGFLVSSFCIQGITDWFVYGYPYASFIHYTFDNSSNAYNYLTGGWYVYIFTIMGVLIPPTSLLLMFGYFTQWKRLAVLFWPVLIFLAFHSIFPNKQERFILPAIPLFIMIGCIGWREFVRNSLFWQKHIRLHKGLWNWFWVVNIVLLLVVSTAYSKRARVEVMNYFFSVKDVSAILVETSDASAPALPVFYMNKKVPIYYMTRYDKPDSIRTLFTDKTEPNYLVMLNVKRMDERHTRIHEIFPDIHKVKDISPGFIDQLLVFMNPRHNVNQTCSIYKINSHAGEIKTAFY